MDESTDVVQATLHILSNISQCQLSMFSLIKKVHYIQYSGIQCN